jgi:putative FmdB family regulatory protein
MPTYVYRCPVCVADDVEVVHPIAEDPEVRCVCGVLRRRVPQAPGLVFRGGGWAGRRDPAKVGVEGKSAPARPWELGGGR